MPDAIITSTASTFGTISGTFAADQSTITGTVTGIITGTLDGSVGVPGVGVPDGGTTGQVLQKATNTSYDTVWATPSGGAWGTITGTLSNQTDLQNALDAKQSVSGMSAYLSKAGNLTGLTDLAAARDNLNLGTLNTPVFNGVTAQGSGLNVANLGATFLTLNHTGYGQFTIQPSTGITFPDATIQTTAYPGPVGATTWGSIVGTLSNQTDLQTALNLKAPLASPGLTGVPTAPTAATLTSTTQLATTAFVQQELLSGTANAKNLEVYVRNQTGSTIPAGAIVYINGATGNRPTITLAQANNDANSAQTFGFVKASIANNGFGYVIVRGELENIDTSALTEGVQLYLSPTTPGTWTTTKPSAPQHLVYVGICVRAHPTQGVILVAVQNGYELNELHDVQITSPTNGQVLKYNSTTSLWYNGLDVGIPVGGTAGQFLTKIDGTDYNTDWTTVNLSVYAVKANNLSDLTSAPDARTNLGLGTMATATASDYSTTTVANGLYYPLSTNPAGYLTSASLTGYATESWVTAGFYPLTGNPSGFITSSALTPYLTSATAAATYQTLSGMSSYLTTSAAASTYLTQSNAATTYYPLTGNPSSFLVAADIANLAPKASPALTGNVTITTNSTSPALFIEQSGTGNILTLHDQASDTTFVAIDQSGKIGTIASTTANAGFNVPHGAAPTTPVNGDIWTTTAGLLGRFNGTTLQFAPLGSNNTFSNASSTYGSSTATGTIGLASGATISGSTKTLNIGTGGVAGSTTNITIGSTTGTSTTTLQGTTNGVTAAADTNSVALATTAYVVGQAGSATPLVDGTAAVGTSLRYARQDHVHPTDTTRLATANNLSELTATASTARTNIGLGTISTVNDAPSDGSTYGRNNGAWVVAGGGGGSGADVQTFTTAGTATWTKPAGKTMALIRLFGGAGGGGAGGRYATSSARAGGAAGQVGGMVEVVIPLASLGATETVTVGAGGNGGTSATTDTTAGGAGSAGGNTTFWNLIARGGAGGVGGTTATASQVSAASSFFSVMGMRDGTAVVGGNGSANGAPNAGANITINFLGPTGAAGGVGQSASVLTSAAGGAGGSKVSLSTASGYNVTMAGGAGGTTGGVAATAGTSGVAMMIGGTGGGGGAYRTGVAGMAGGAGGQPSGAGAGGSASDNGFNSGAGGKGGDGMVVVVCY